MNKGYIILCEWSVDGHSESEIIANTVFTSLQEAKDMMQDCIDEDIQENSIHERIARRDMPNGVIEFGELYYSAYIEGNSDDWSYHLTIKEVKIV